MTITIGSLQLSELIVFLREQADDAFPELKDEERLNLLAEKWHSQAEFSMCRNNEGRLVGMIAFYANRPENGVVYIPHVYVSSNFRAKHLMSSMLNSIKEYVKDKGFLYMRLEVNKVNERAQKAYLQYGFVYAGDASDKSDFMQYIIS